MTASFNASTVALHVASSPWPLMFWMTGTSEKKGHVKVPLTPVFRGSCVWMWPSLMATVSYLGLCTYVGACLENFCNMVLIASTTTTVL